MKLIVSDFDGTLYYREMISAADREAIGAFRAEGGLFGIVTGRGMGAVLEILQKQAFLPDFLICCSGGVIVDRKKGMVRAHHGSGAVLPELFDLASRFGCQHFHVSDGLYEYRADLSSFTKNEFSRMFSFTQCHISFDSVEVAESFSAEARRYLGSKLTAYIAGNSVNLSPTEVNKLHGIEVYRAYVGGDPETYTVGDREYDLPMLTKYNGYAVSNASEEVKRQSPHTCRRVADMIADILKV